MSGPVRGVRRIEQADLSGRNTFGVAVRAPLLLQVDRADALPALAAAGQLPPGALVLGGGSNVLFAGTPQAPVVALGMREVRLLDARDGPARIRAEAGAGWHRLVLWSLAQGLSGLENLALIPGTAGAAPIQNIGAYGVEAGERIVAVEAFERAAGRFVRLDNAACAFAYRDSLFKRDPDAYVVTAVELALDRSAAPRVEYAGIGDELHAMGVARPGPRDVAEAVIRLRTRKLPDPARIGNAGSFFKNPLVPEAQAAALQAAHPALPVFAAGRTGLRKLSAAWLIDRCGWKGHRDGDAGVSDRHALVLVNHGAATGLQLLDLARRIAESVHARFGVAIEPEPRIVGARW